MSQLICRREVASFAVTKVAYRANESLPRHTHDRPYFCHVLKGSYRGTYGSHAETAAPGNVAFRAAGEPHVVQFSPAGAQVVIIEVRPERFHVPLPEQATRFDSAAFRCVSQRLVREFVNEDASSDLALEGIGLELVATLLRAESSKGSRAAWLGNVEQYVREHATQHFDLAALGSIAQRHPAYVATAFRRAFGVSIGEYVRRVRIGQACHQLMMSDLSHAEIAHASGFADQSHFIRVFKRMVGVTPARFRASEARSISFAPSNTDRPSHR